MLLVVCMETEALEQQVEVMVVQAEDMEVMGALLVEEEVVLVDILVLVVMVELLQVQLELMGLVGLVVEADESYVLAEEEAVA